jgi:hypothetical protein
MVPSALNSNILNRGRRLWCKVIQTAIHPLDIRDPFTDPMKLLPRDFDHGRCSCINTMDTAYDDDLPKFPLAFQDASRPVVEENGHILKGSNPSELFLNNGRRGADRSQPILCHFSYNPSGKGRAREGYPFSNFSRGSPNSLATSLTPSLRRVLRGSNTW